MFFQCNTCLLLLVYTIHLSLSTDSVDSPTMETIYMKHALCEMWCEIVPVLWIPGLQEWQPVGLQHKIHRLTQTFHWETIIQWIIPTNQVSPNNIARVLVCIFTAWLWQNLCFFLFFFKAYMLKIQRIIPKMHIVYTMYTTLM